MRLWRISNYDDLSGVGGLKVSGRWHERGRHVVYTSDHPASALLEVMVHLEIDFEDLPDTFQLLEIDVPHSIAIERIDVADLERVSQDWKEDPKITRGILTPWFDDARTAVVGVPSAIMPFSTNFLISPRHADAANISVIRAARYPHDRRLFEPPEATDF